MRTGSRRIQDMYKNDSERADREQKDTGHCIRMTQSGRTGSRRIQDMYKNDSEREDWEQYLYKNESEREGREQKDTGHIRMTQSGRTEQTDTEHE